MTKHRGSSEYGGHAPSRPPDERRTSRRRPRRRPDLAGKGRCNADALGWAVGQTLDEATGRRLFKDSGAGLWRVVAPDNTFGRDRREDRLNVRVDQAQRIVAVDCG